MNFTDPITRAQLAIICMEARVRQTEHQLSSLTWDEVSPAWSVFDRIERRLDRRQKALARLAAHYQTLTA